MITKNDLKQIVMLTYLSDSMLDNLAQITDILRFEKDEVIFRENEPSERFYMLRSGQVLLEKRISDQVTVFVGSIKSGYSFGWSAMMQGGTYSLTSVCEQPGEAFSFKSEKIWKLFREDPEMGLRMHQRLLVIIKKRLDLRTEQFSKAIMNHPDMQSLFQ
jgi:CRP-like cAMP-binding protein